jgi:hypothetical protein
VPSEANREKHINFLEEEEKSSRFVGGVDMSNVAGKQEAFGKTRSFRENKKLYYVLGFPSFIMPAIAAHNSARNK